MRLIRPHRQWLMPTTPSIHKTLTAQTPQYEAYLDTRMTPMRLFFWPTWMFLLILSASGAHAQSNERAQEDIMQQPRTLSVPSDHDGMQNIPHRAAPSTRMMPRPAPARSQFHRSKSPNNRRLRDSVRSIERNTGGRVLRAESFSRGGNETHRVKVLTPDGRVRIMQSTPRPRPEVIVHPVQTPERN